MPSDKRKPALHRSVVEEWRLTVAILGGTLAASVWFYLDPAPGGWVPAAFMVVFLLLFAGNVYEAFILRRALRREGPLVVANTVLLLVASIVVFAWTYWSLQPPSGVTQSETKADHLYFSVVTFTTLGYGDMAPLGQARFLAGLQALLGAFFTPLLIAEFVALNLRRRRLDERELI